MIRFALSVLLVLGFTLQTAAQTPSAKVFKREGDTYYLGKLYIPKGAGKLKLKHTRSNDGIVELYYGHVDRTKIYLYPMVLTEDCYYVDGTDCSHAFVVRTTTPEDVVMETATAADDELIEANSSYYWNYGLSFQNKLRFNTEQVSNNDLREKSTYKSKNVYIMGNPARYGLVFLWVDQFGTSRYLPANSLYVLTNRSSSAPEQLEVVWPDDDFENTTAIKTSNAACSVDNAVYSLAGQKMGTTADFANLPKGLYIINGRKVVKK